MTEHKSPSPRGRAMPDIGPDEMPAWLIEHGILLEFVPGVFTLTGFGHNLTHVLVEIHDRLPRCKPIKGASS